MQDITAAAKKYSQVSLGNYEVFSPERYDAFIAGATAPETEAYYKAKYSLIAGDCDSVQTTNGDLLPKARQEVLRLIAEGNLLKAVVTWKEANPGMGLRDAKNYIDSLR